MPSGVHPTHLLGREQDLEASSAKKLGEADPRTQRKLEDLRNDVSKLEYSLSAATAEYERIAAINQQVRVPVGVRA